MFVSDLLEMRESLHIGRASLRSVQRDHQGARAIALWAQGRGSRAKHDRRRPAAGRAGARRGACARRIGGAGAGAQDAGAEADAESTGDHRDTEPRSGATSLLRWRIASNGTRLERLTAGAA